MFLRKRDWVWESYIDQRWQSHTQTRGVAETKNSRELSVSSLLAFLCFSVPLNMVLQTSFEKYSDHNLCVRLCGLWSVSGQQSPSSVLRKLKPLINHQRTKQRNKRNNTHWWCIIERQNPVFTDYFKNPHIRFARCLELFRQVTAERWSSDPTHPLLWETSP